AIVGAIANEGGLRRSDFGHISIRPDHSLVELPADLSSETLEALRRTRISGVLIQLQPDSGPPSGRPRGGRDDRAGGKFQRDRDSRKRPRE
ncbi:DbpA RNA binding domain-containing protein, partial [Rhodococcus opacus]